MSLYANMNGEIWFSSPEKKNLALKLLSEGGWIDNDTWLDETGGKEDELEQGDLHITIPLRCYRNLSHRLEELFSLAVGWDVVWSSTDGMFEGFIYSNGGDIAVDLDKWGIENVGEKPFIKDPDNLTEDEELALSEWQSEVAWSFASDPNL